MSEVLSLLKTGNDDIAWFEHNLTSLKSRYNNRFVAFRNKQVVSSGKDLNSLFSDLDKKGVSRSSVLVEFVSDIRSIL